MKGTEGPIVLVHTPLGWKPAGDQQLSPPRLAWPVPQGCPPCPPVPPWLLSRAPRCRVCSLPTLPAFAFASRWDLPGDESRPGDIMAQVQMGVYAAGDMGNITICFCLCLEQGSLRDILTKFFKSTSRESELHRELIIFSKIE